MLIDSGFLSSGDLELKAYTFDIKEFTALESTLSQAGIGPLYRHLPNDRSNREARAYLVPRSEISNLEALLHGSFKSSGFLPSVDGGQSYRCKEVDLSGHGRGCEDITAPNKSVAQTKCALIARKKNWFGGVPSPGQCP
jgi:hypothetical protein